MAKLAKALSGVVILLNLYFVYLTILVIWTGGGAWGYGLLIIPINLVAHFFLIPAITTLKSKKFHTAQLFFNSLGALWTIYWGWTFITI
jgi:hypothetical protein